MKYIIMQSNGNIVIPAHILARKLGKDDWATWFRDLKMKLGEDYILGFASTLSSGSLRKELIALIRPQSLLNHTKLNIKERHPHIHESISNVCALRERIITSYEVVDYMNHDDIKVEYINKRVSMVLRGKKDHPFKHGLERIRVNIKGWNDTFVHGFCAEHVPSLFVSSRKANPISYRPLRAWLDKRMCGFWGDISKDDTLGAAQVIRELKYSPLMRLLLSDGRDLPIQDYVGEFVNHSRASKLEKLRVDQHAKEVREKHQRDIASQIKKCRASIPNLGIPRFEPDQLGKSSMPEEPKKAKKINNPSRHKDDPSVASSKKIWRPSSFTPKPKKRVQRDTVYVPQVKFGITRKKADKDSIEGFCKEMF